MSFLAFTVLLLVILVVLVAHVFACERHEQGSFGGGNCDCSASDGLARYIVARNQ